MINIKIKGSNNIQRGAKFEEVELPLSKRYLWIGRGQEIKEKQNENNNALDLAMFSKAVSRIHSQIIFSPSLFTKNYHIHPSYFKRLKSWGDLSDNILDLIWYFCRPAKKIILKDLQSKSGVFKKISQSYIFSGMNIVLGDSRPIVYHNQQIYDTPQALSQRLQQLRSKDYTILNSPAYRCKSFWILSYRSAFFILLNSNSDKIYIGRSGECHLIIAQSAISRKHAYLDYTSRGWKLVDGDGANASSNGVWLKTRNAELAYRNREMKIVNGQNLVKIGDILLTFTIRQKNHPFNIESCVSINRSTDGSCQQLPRKEIQFQEGLASGEESN